MFGKKKKKGEDGEETIEELSGDEEMLIDPDLLDIPDESEIKKKKPGFFATLFAKLFEEVGEGRETDVDAEQLAGVKDVLYRATSTQAAANRADFDGFLHPRNRVHGRHRGNRRRSTKKSPARNRHPDLLMLCMWRTPLDGLYKLRDVIFILMVERSDDDVVNELTRAFGSRHPGIISIFED